MTRRGLTLLELLLALSITAMVAAAIAAMLGAVSTGVGTRRDNRTVMVLANAAESRLAAYIAPSRCVLDVADPNVVLWLNDNHESETVHATEIRWLQHDAAAGTISVSYVCFPDGWTQAACDLEDLEYTSAANWDAVRAHYQVKGWLATLVLVDNLDSVGVTCDQSDQISRHVMYELLFATNSLSSPIAVTGTIRQHQQPTS